jgi:Zn finger protein HypA/HybF involved in hydrogenase expression
VETQKEFRCPYCVVDEKFHLMNGVSKGRLICKNCGHIVFPNDTDFKCPSSQESMQIVPASASEVTGLFLSHVHGQSN